MFTRKPKSPGARSRLSKTRLTLEQLGERIVPSIDLGPIVNPANGHTYYRLTQSSWTTAENEAISLGGHLVTINDAAENDWVYSTFGSPTEAWRNWIGLNDLSHRFTYSWASGEPVTYTAWLPGQPTFFGNGPEDCVELNIFLPGQPVLWNDLPDTATAGAIPGGTPMKGIVELPTPPADIAMTSAQLLNGNTVQFTYETTGSPGEFQAGLYASANGVTYNPSDQIGDLQTVTPSPTNPQTPGTFALPSPWNPDPAKPYLVVVADPGQAIPEADESNNIAPVALVNVTTLSAKLFDSKTIEFTYQTSGPLSSFGVAVYRSSDSNFGTDDVLVPGTESVITVPGSGVVTDTISLSSEMPIDPVRKFVLVVADPQQALNETNEIDNDDAFFRKLVMGIVTHGLVPEGVMPPWVDVAADKLDAQGYDETIRFDWAYNSRRPVANQATNAGLSMANQVRSMAAEMLNAPGGTSNDVVDLHFIGHSRGSVVISKALQDLNEVPGPLGLAHGYYKMTMLDPHPARNKGSIAQGLVQALSPSGDNSVGSFALNPTLGTVGRLLRAGVVLGFQAAAQDPQLVIPQNVDVTQSYYQRKRWIDTSGLDFAAGLNLWGSTPNEITNLSSGQCFATDVSLFVTGHTGVPDWYLTLL